MKPIWVVWAMCLTGMFAFLAGYNAAPRNLHPRFVVTPPVLGGLSGPLPDCRTGPACVIVFTHQEDQ